MSCALLALATLLAVPPAAPEAPPPSEARLLRFPDIHGDLVVFVYGGDLWRAPVAEGAALIVDDRYNGGGFIPDRMIEYFTRRTLAYWARRGIESFKTPGFAHDGPKAMLINAYSASGGDALPNFFKKQGLGPLIGTRTWGGLIGLSGNPRLLDGGEVEIPTFRIYDASGQWVIENEGVSPDIEVIDLPESRIAGGDPSLEKAAEVLLKELEARPQMPVAAPAPPRH